MRRRTWRFTGRFHALVWGAATGVVLAFAVTGGLR
jgi:hypothetical protein